MKQNSTFTIISLTILSFLISAFLLDDEIRSFERDEDGIGKVLINVRFIFMSLLLIGLIVYSIIRMVRKRTYGFLFPTAVCVIHFGIVITLRVKLQIRESSPVVLQAHYDGDINGLTLYLRQNNTYKLSDFAFLGGTNHYGDYRLDGDTILLSEKYPLGKDRDIMTNKLLKANGFILIKPDSNGNYPKDEFFKLKIVK